VGNFINKTSFKRCKKITCAGLKSKVDQLINVLKTNPYQNPPSYEKLTGDLADMYSRRINIQHRLVYEVDNQAHRVKILMMWSHYE
jgi:Txe/YoeB family toxin of toxin-antitoxin system